MENRMRLEFDAVSVNESFALVAVSAFFAQLNPTVDEIEDVKTAVSEAVTNSIIHGYGEKEGTVVVTCTYHDKDSEVVVIDEGVGIADIEKSMEPFFTTKSELERSGMGFAFMEAFMDEVSVESEPLKGTKVTMKKRFGERKLEE